MTSEDDRRWLGVLIAWLVVGLVAWFAIVALAVAVLS